MYATATLSELKVIARNVNAPIPTGDKRSKQAWIDAIELAQAFAAPEMPSEAEQESIAHAAPTRPARAAKSLSALIDRELSQPSPAPSPLPEVAVESPVLAEGHSKSGAVIVVGALVCIIVLLFRTLLFGACTIARCGIYLCRLFGKYDPSLDIWYQLQNRIIEREARQGGHQARQDDREPTLATSLG